MVLPVPFRERTKTIFPNACTPVVTIWSTAPPDRDKVLPYNVKWIYPSIPRLTRLVRWRTAPDCSGESFRASAPKAAARTVAYARGLGPPERLPCELHRLPGKRHQESVAEGNCESRCRFGRESVCDHAASRGLARREQVPSFVVIRLLISAPCSENVCSTIILTH
jgi:hypothetical protein